MPAAIDRRDRALTLVLGLAGLVHAQAVTPDEARRLFERYVALGNAYDGASRTSTWTLAHHEPAPRPVAGQDRMLEIDGAGGGDWSGADAGGPARGDRSESSEHAHRSRRRAGRACAPSATRW